MVYRYLGVGHKTNALTVGLQQLPRSCDFVLHLDDDTMLPEHFVLDEGKFTDDAVSAISYGIEMVHENQGV